MLQFSAIDIDDRKIAKIVWQIGGIVGSSSLLDR
jgi:hypothetical protein